MSKNVCARSPRKECCVDWITVFSLMANAIQRRGESGPEVFKCFNVYFFGVRGLDFKDYVMNVRFSSCGKRVFRVIAPFIGHRFCVM